MLRFDERFLSMRTWVTSTLASIVTPAIAPHKAAGAEPVSACLHPMGHNTCKCHQQMGVDFYFMPIDRCMYQ